MRQAVARFRTATPGGFPAPDLALAGLMCAVAVASVLAGAPAEGPIALTLPVAIVTTGALIWRRRSPVVAAALVIAAGMTQTLLSQSPGSLWALVVFAMVMYAIAAWYTESIAAIVGAVLMSALLIEEKIDNGVDYVFLLLLFGAVWLLGRASRSWRGRVTTAEQRQRDAARLAVAQDRVRIARDLHDVIAHSLSVIAVQSDAAEAALLKDPSRAVEPVRVIRSTARDSLAEIRRFLDVLRADDTDLPGIDSPGISAIAGLVEAARAAGLTVTEHVELTDSRIATNIDLTAFRIVQEALTNAIKHAPGCHVLVTITQSRTTLSVLVENSRGQADTKRAAPGYGLIGMHERVNALRGEISASPTDSGGFAVSVRIPLVESHALRGST